MLYALLVILSYLCLGLNSLSSCSLLCSCSCQAPSVLPCLNVTDGNQSLHEDLDVATGSRRLRSGEQELLQSSLAEGLQRSHQQALHKDVNHHDLEELQQEPDLAGPEATEEPEDRVVDLVLCQTVADETPANQPVAEHLTHGRFIPDNPATVALSGHIEELLQVDHASFTNDLLVRPGVIKAEEDEKPLDSRSSKMEMESDDPQGALHSLPASSRTKVAFKSEDSDAVTSGGTRAHQTEGTL